MGGLPASEIQALLHDVWLRVHVRRFDKKAPDSLYNGIRIAEQVIHEVAAEHGIGWHALRAALTTDPSEASQDGGES